MQSRKPNTYHATQRHGEEKNQTVDTEDGVSGGEEGLPQTEADGHGLEHRPKPVEWKPTPDMYRMDTPEGQSGLRGELWSEDWGIGRSDNTAEGGGATRAWSMCTPIARDEVGYTAERRGAESPTSP